MNKAELRNVIRAKRIAQPAKEALSRIIVVKFLALPEYAAAKTVLWYVDAGSEVRTRDALMDALNGPRRIAVPFCVVETNELELFHLRDFSDLVPGSYGLLEPRNDLRSLPERRIQPNEIDLAMVPGIAFDPHGGRLGQGNGYYDRLLAKLRPDCLRVGLAFDCQIVPQVPTETHDIPMHRVITQTTQWSTGPS